MVRSILFMLLTCIYISVSAQTDSVTATTTASSPTKQVIDFRIPKEDKIKEFQKDDRFNYKRVERGASWWDKLKFEFWNFINKLLRAAANSGVPGIVVIIVIVLIICLIVLKLLGVDYRTILGKKTIDTPEIDIYSENVHEMDFDTLITNALNNNDYRLVVRFVYLKSLKLLSDKDMIEWKPTKTNYSYQYEISNPTLRTKFLEATLIFDYIWYGEFSLDEPKFSDIYARMNDFNKMIANER